jgi:hypothetical protein
MSHSKGENLKQCVSLLREFVEKSTARDNKKGTAILALNQLQKVIAGTNGEADVIVRACTGRPILGIS